MNCLTGESADTRLTSQEMSQLISNVNMLAFSHSLTHTNFYHYSSTFCSFAALRDLKNSICIMSRIFNLQILEESDIDKDGTVNLSEFQHVISRSPDFVR